MGLQPTFKTLFHVRGAIHCALSHLPRGVADPKTMSSGTKTEEHNNLAEISSTQSSQPQSIEEAGSKAAFLATFTPQDDKDVMRKVDRRFLLLIGILYMTKNVSAVPSFVLKA